ncbi:hypothetical protein [Bacillus sp. 1NLA3E]|nr:hypothetical protein [Bacillus sp. 1NLA3E]
MLEVKKKGGLLVGDIAQAVAYVIPDRVYVSNMNIGPTKQPI